MVAAHAASAAPGASATPMETTPPPPPRPAQLSAWFDPPPPPRNLGQPFLLVLTVSNTGQARALDASLSPFGFAGPRSEVRAGPLASATAPLDGGEAMTFTWTCAGLAAGWTAFTVTVTAEDEFRRQAVWTWATSPPVRITRPARLLAAASLSRQAVSAGQWVVLKLTVTNEGEAAAAGVGPALADRSTARLTWLKGPAPAGPVSLDGGRSVRFAWGWLTRSPGGIALLAGAAGRDATSGAAVACGVTVTGRVETPAALAVSLDSSATRFNLKDRIQIRVTAANEGEAALTLRPPPPKFEGLGRATLKDAPPADTVTLTGGATRTWTFAYEAAAPGPLRVTAQASGRDVNTGQEIGAAAEMLAPLAIGSPAMTIKACFTSPAHVDLGDVITVTVTVANTGAFVLDAAAPRPLQVDGDGGVAYEGGPSPVAMTIPVGDQATFVWRERAAGPGTVVFRTTVVAWDGTASPEAKTSGVPISSIRRGTARRR